jgi:hypothetical protein
MSAKEITLCDDETFHQGRPCLVAAEPCSGFLLVESYQPDRTEKTWSATVKKGLLGLPVKVVQVTADEACALKAHARDGLGAHYSPDLMHLQQSLHQATGLALQSQLAAAKELERKCQAEYQAIVTEHPEAAWDRAEPAAQARFERASDARSRAEAEATQCEKNREQVKEAIRGFADDYHPFDLKEGKAVKAAEMTGRLQTRLDRICEAAKDAGLEQAQGKIGRVRQMLGALAATLCWFWLQLSKISAAQGWSEEAAELFKDKVAAWAYWRQSADKGRNAKERKERRELTQRLWQSLQQDARWGKLSAEQQQQMLLLGKEAASRWQRSSSCVEGRNGRLRLKQHTRQGLTDKGLAVQTVLHNYWLRRDDGSTAAERFFGQKPQDLFSWLLARLPALPRPAQRRKKAA